MKITLIEPRGFCFGVCRALQMLDKAPQNTYVLHEIVHNTSVVSNYKEKGIRFVENLEDIPDGSTVVFSAHGVSKSIQKRALQKKLNIIDTTCPFVQSVHRWVEKIENENRTVILIGKEKHAEIIGTLGQLKHPQKAFVIHTKEEVEKLPNLKYVGIATQTTLSKDETEKIINALKNKFNDCALQSGICKATTERQEAVKKACLTNDTILVVGDKKSSNSIRLLEVAKKLGKNAFLIEKAEEVKTLTLGSNIAITAAASAPETIVQQVIKQLQS